MIHSSKMMSIPPKQGVLRYKLKVELARAPKLKVYLILISLLIPQSNMLYSNLILI